MARKAVYVSVQLTESEKAHLDNVVKASGLPRNRFLRNLIASLVPKR